MTVVFLLIVAVAIFLVVKSKKKKKENEERKEQEQLERFKEYLLARADYSSHEDYFFEIYKTALEVSGISEKELDLLCAKIPEYKARFSSACEKLLKVDKSNVCFMENPPSSVSDDKITHDIIEALPIMAQFYGEYNEFYEDAYYTILYEKMIKFHHRLFGVFYKKIDGTLSDKDEAIFDKALSVVQKYFDDLIEQSIRDFIGLDDNYVIKNSPIPTIQKFVRYAEKITEEEKLFEEFLRVWINSMHKKSDKYITAEDDCCQYFKQIEAKMQESFSWFSMSLFFKFPDAYLLLEEKSKEECLKVLKLYESGRLSGKYCYYMKNNSIN